MTGVRAPDARGPLVVVRGGGELGTGAARLLFLSGLPVLVLEREPPLAVRRLVSFAEAVVRGAVDVEGVRGVRVAIERAGAAATLRRAVPVVVDAAGAALALLRPGVVVDARMAKRNLGSTRADAELVIGLGPGFVAGADVHAVVETQRGPALGRVIWEGRAEPDTRRPAPVAGVGVGRVLRAPEAGVFVAAANLGDLVAAGAVLGRVGSRQVRAEIAGRLRGLIADGVAVEPGEKLGDIDPRGAEVDAARVSDKARAVAAGVLEAVYSGLAARRLEPASAAEPGR